MLLVLSKCLIRKASFIMFGFAGGGVGGVRDAVYIAN